MQKPAIIYKIVYTVLIEIFLFLLFIKAIDIKTKIIIIPFIICGLSIIGKNISLILEKQKYVKIFSKLFIISFLTFSFGFLTFYTYLCIDKQNYLTIIFEIPFFIVGIYLGYKFLIKKDKKSPQKKITNIKKIITFFLILSILIIGISCLFMGIYNTYKLKEKTKDYLITDGYYKNYEVYKADNDESLTYKLNYIYKVEEKEYQISTEYGVSIEQITTNQQ